MLPQTQKDLPIQLLTAATPLKASVVLASFGSAQGLDAPVFEVKVEPDPTLPPPTYEKPLRYGKKPEIHHIFRPDPKSPPKVVSLFFAVAVVATLPALLIGVSDAPHGPSAVQFHADVADVDNNSGPCSERTSTTFPRRLARRRSRTRRFSGLFWPWNLSFSCTTRAGTCSRRSRSPPRSRPSRCSAGRRRWGRCRAGGLRESAERQLACVGCGEEEGVLGDVAVPSGGARDGSPIV